MSREMSPARNSYETGGSGPAKPTRNFFFKRPSARNLKQLIVQLAGGDHHNRPYLRRGSENHATAIATW